MQQDAGSEHTKRIKCMLYKIMKRSNLPWYTVEEVVFFVCDCPIHKMLLSPLNYDIIVDIKSNLQNAWKKQTCLCGSLLTCWWWLYWFLYLISLSFGNSGEMDCITMRDWKHGCVASLLETDTSDQCCMCPVVSYLHDFTSALRSAPVNCLYV